MKLTTLALLRYARRIVLCIHHEPPASVSPDGRRFRLWCRTRATTLSCEAWVTHMRSSQALPGTMPEHPAAVPPPFPVSGPRIESIKCGSEAGWSAHVNGHFVPAHVVSPLSSTAVDKPKSPHLLGIDHELPDNPWCFFFRRTLDSQEASRVCAGRAIS